MLKAVNGWTPALIVAASVIAVVSAVWLLFEHWFPLSAAPPPPSKLVRVAATPQLPALVYFENPDYPYDVGYPTGWRPVTGDPESVMFEGAAGREIRVAAAAVPQVEPAMTLPVYADRQVEALRRQTPTLIELQRSRVVLPNAQAGVEVDSYLERRQRNKTRAAAVRPRFERCVPAPSRRPSRRILRRAPPARRLASVVCANAAGLSRIAAGAARLARIAGRTPHHPASYPSTGEKGDSGSCGRFIFPRLLITGLGNLSAGAVFGRRALRECQAASPRVVASSREQDKRGDGNGRAPEQRSPANDCVLAEMGRMLVEGEPSETRRPPCDGSARTPLPRFYFWGCNPGFLVTSEGCVLFDAPQQPNDAVRWREAIEAHGPIRYLINTEPHNDHIRGNAYFPGVEVIGQSGMPARYQQAIPAMTSRNYSRR